VGAISVQDITQRMIIDGARLDHFHSIPIPDHPEQHRGPSEWRQQKPKLRLKECRQVGMFVCAGQAKTA